MIQEEVSRIQLYISAARHIPAVFASLILGPFTDKHGRRPAMILSLTGNFLWVLLLLFNVYLKFSPYYFIVGCFIDGCCGGVGTYLFASFAYIADTSATEDRTRKIAITESMIFLGGFIASVAEGLLADKLGFAIPLIAVIVCYIALALYIVMWLPEPRKVSSVRSYNYRSHFRKTLSVICSASEDRSMLWLILTTFSLLTMAFAGTNNIIILFLLDKPYNWNKSGIGYFLAFNTLLNGMVAMFVLPQSSRLIGDYWTSMISVIATFIGFVLFGVSNTDWMLFLGSTVNAVGVMSIPTLRSKMSKMISPNSQGSLFSLISASDIFWVLISSSAMSKIYEVTHDYYHGFCFLIEAGLAFLTIGLLYVGNLMERKKEASADNELLISDDDCAEVDNPPDYVLTEQLQHESIEQISMQPQLFVHTDNLSYRSTKQDPCDPQADLSGGFEYLPLEAEIRVAGIKPACGHVTCSSNV